MSLLTSVAMAMTRSSEADFHGNHDLLLAAEDIFLSSDCEEEKIITAELD